MGKMKGLIMGLIVLLSLSSGASKVMLISQETAFFGRFGFSDIHIVMIGICQIVGGILVVFPRTRKFGALLVGLTFLLSSILIFKDGNTGSCVFSLLPVLLLYWGARDPQRTSGARSI